MHRVQRLLVVVFALLLIALPGIAGAAAPEALDAAGIQRLINHTGGQAEVRLHAATGAARFVRMAPGSLRLDVPAKASPEQRALAFFAEHGRIFGITRVDRDLTAVRSFKDGMGSEHLVFAQNYRGVPVFGGELRAHFNPKGDLVAVNGSFVPRIKLGTTTPTLTPEQAAGTAVGVVVKQQGNQREINYHLGEEAQIVAVSTDLVVFRSGLVQGVVGGNYLAYRVEVANAALTVREFLFLDAHSGIVLEQITGIHHALDREVYESSLANLVWDESNGDPNPIPAGWAGGTAQQVTDWQNEIDGAEETYYLFASMTSGAYLSYDGVGATMITINNNPAIACPNATWNGVSTNYCTGVTGDDTVAHEWGHAYTQFTNDLIYQWQSGALNEAYSDIWGEVVDLLNGRGTDAPNTPRSAGSCSVFGNGAPSVDNTYRWLSGEDDPAFGGAIRDMWNPLCYGHPGKVTDQAQYICSTFDNGGVHINSGIPNHAFALMVDGGTYNGFTITGIGLTKASHIHWAAQNILTLTSNFVEHADALEVACSNLTGINLPALSTSTTSPGLSGEIITAADCAEVAEINDAVEFRTEPTFCNFAPLLDPNAPALCAGLGSTNTVFSEDWEGGSLPAGWTASSHDVANPASFDNPGWLVTGNPAGANGSFSAFVPDLNQGDCAADDESGALSLDSPAIALPAGAVPHVAFDHWVASEDGWDGGNVKISVNGGAYTQIPASAFTFNGYNTTLNSPPGNTNPLADQDVFSGSDDGSVSGSWGQSQINLIGIAAPGDTVSLRFDFGVDGCFGLIGWYVDDVSVYTCSDEEPPICGDGKLDPGENCDDGNANDGDGCSSSCQEEDGWNCTDPVPPTSGANVVNDGSFEAGAFGGTWAESSSTFGTPVCDIGSCGTGTGTGPSDGDFWVWFGGIAAFEEGSVSQSVTIPAAATDLTFDLEQIVCDSAADFMELTIDGNQEFLTNGTATICGTLGYSAQSVDISAYADGLSHTVEFHSQIFANNGGGSNFFVDNVVISDNTPTSGSPSVCQEIATEVSCNGGIVEFDDGIPSEWSTVDDAGFGLTWSNIVGAGESGNYTGGTGDAATVSSDAFGPSDFDTSLITNSFSLANAASADLDYLVNYQNFAAFDFLDVDISTDGGANWSNVLSWNEDHGGFRGEPGEAVSLDLSTYVGASDVKLRWRYYDPTTFDWDWYAQVDNVALTCNLIPDCDGATASPGELWPPNHKFHTISIHVTDPDGDPVTVTVTDVVQDEPLNGPGDGNTNQDCQINGSTADVRAERAGGGDGRVYHIDFTADDGRGGVCTGTVQVGVPHDQSGAPAVDSGPPYFDSGC